MFIWPNWPYYGVFGGFMAGWGGDRVERGVLMPREAQEGGKNPMFNGEPEGLIHPIID